jgi:hypothetical protein
MTYRERNRFLANEVTPVKSLSYISGYGSCSADPTTYTAYSAGDISSSLKNIQSESMIDIVTPEFERLSSEGVIVNNPLQHVKSYEFDPGVVMYYKSHQNVWDCTPKRCRVNRKRYWEGPLSIYSLTGDFLADPLYNYDSSSLKAIVSTKAWSNVDQSEMLAGASLFEANKTVEGITDLLKKVNKILLALRRKDASALKKEASISEISDLYMNARYNLRPLYYDAVGLMNAMKKALLDTPQRQTFRAVKAHTAKDSAVGVKTIPLTGAIQPKVDFTKSVYSEVKIRAGILCDLERITDPQIFGFDRIAETAWDLTPFSFICDWFLNVGDTIAAFSPNLGIRPLASWMTEIKTVIQRNTVVDGYVVPPTPTYCIAYEPMDFSITSGYAEKRVVTTVRTPTLDRYQMPTWCLHLDPLKLLDLGIILARGKNNASYIRAGM